MVRDGGGRYGGLRANGAVLRGSVITHIQEEEWSFTVAPLWDKMNGITVFLFQCNYNRSRCQKKGNILLSFPSFYLLYFPEGQQHAKRGTEAEEICDVKVERRVREVCE